jgi:transposase-like protein
MTHVLHGPHCYGTDIGRHGKTPQGEQPYRCRETACARRTFLPDYAFPGQSSHITAQIVEVARHASGMRDTARV